MKSLETFSIEGGSRMADALNVDRDQPPSLVDTTTSSLIEHLKCRFVCEWKIIRHRLFPEWVCILFFILYINQYVLRTLAFYRHRQIVDYIPTSWCDAISTSPNRPVYWKAGDSCVDHATNLTNHATLVDLMQDMIPDAEANEFLRVLPEALEGFSVVSFACMVLYCSVIRRPGQRGKRPYIANMLTRCLRNLVFLFATRPLYYLATSLPGPAAKCIGQKEVSVKPKHWYEIFYDFSLGGANCGDLIFSGHMSGLIVVVCCFLQYGRSLLHPHVFLFNIGRCLFVIVVLVQVVLIAAAKNHYTVDMICAMFMGFMFWRLSYLEFGPDPEPIQFHASFSLKSSIQPEVLEMYRDDAVFARYVNYEGTKRGGVVMALISVVFFGIVIATFVVLLS